MLIRFRLRDAQHGGYSPAQLGIYLVNEFAWVLGSPYCCEIPARTLWEQRHRVLPDFAWYVGGACHSAPEPRGWIRAAPGICHVRTRHQHPMAAPVRGHTALLGAVRPGGGAAGAGQSRRQGPAPPSAALSPQQGGSRYSSRDVTPGWCRCPREQHRPQLHPHGSGIRPSGAHGGGGCFRSNGPSLSPAQQVPAEQAFQRVGTRPNSKLT